MLKKEICLNILGALLQFFVTYLSSFKIKNSAAKIEAVPFSFFTFWPHGVAYEILAPQTGIKPTLPAVVAQNLTWWTIVESSVYIL